VQNGVRPFLSLHLLVCDGFSYISSPKVPSQNGFFSASLSEADPELRRAIAHERESPAVAKIELIASENIVSRAVLEAQGSGLDHKLRELSVAGYYAGANSLVKTEPCASSTAAARRCSRLANQLEFCHCWRSRS